MKYNEMHLQVGIMKPCHFILSNSSTTHTFMPHRRVILPLIPDKNVMQWSEIHQKPKLSILLSSGRCWWEGLEKWEKRGY